MSNSIEVEVFVGIGSNIDPELHIPAAVAGLAELGMLTGISDFYRTLPIGGRDHSSYVNGVIRLRTAITAPELKRSLRAIESALGRVRSTDRYASRTIDLDILLYGVQRFDSLGIPDPDILERPFVAIPMSRIDPEAVIPGSARNVGEVAAAMDSGGMELVHDFWDLVQKRLGGTT